MNPSVGRYFLSLLAAACMPTYSLPFARGVVLMKTVRPEFHLLPLFLFMCQEMRKEELQPIQSTKVDETKRP